jgi:GNAT superfamily N-acetyltransferase
MQRRGQSIWTVIARHDATGALAGWTSLLFPKVRTDVAYQLGTGVEPAHRGHGLGRWVKAVNLLRLLDERPAVQRVETENATNNGPMLAINHALGFSSYRTNGVWEMKTAALAS